MKSINRNVLAVLGAVVALAVWFLATENAGSIYFPPLIEVLGSVWEYWFTGAGQKHLVSSLANLFAGLGIGIVLGFLLGIVIGQQRLVRIALTPALEFVRAIPATALIPFAMVIFGLGPSMKIFIIALGTFFPVLLNVIDGVRELPEQSRDTARSFGIRGWQYQRRIMIPAVIPRLVAGIQIAIPLSLVLVVTSEMTGTNIGIGFVLIGAQQSFNQVSVWGAIVLLGILGILLSGAFTLVQRRILAWDRARNALGDH